MCALNCLLKKFKVKHIYLTKFINGINGMM